MRERFQLPIPFWRVQYQLLGGHRKVLFLVMVYTVVVVFGAFGFQRFTRTQPLTTVCSWILNGLTAIQSFLILFGGSNAIYRAILRDYETKMSESHRLTPMSNIGIVLGYLIGPNLQILLFYVSTLVIGLGVSGIGGLPIGDWVVGNLFMLNAAVMVWSAVVFSGMRPTKPISPAWVLTGLAALFVPIGMLPGAGMLLGIYPVVLSAWVIIGRVPAGEPALFIVGAVTVVFTIFWLAAAAAKYRRPDLPALNAFRGLVLLVLWLLVGAGGLIAFLAITTTRLRFLHDEDLIHVQWLGTLIASLPIATAVTLGTAECRMVVSHGRQPRDWSDRVSDLVVPVVAAVLVCVALALFGQTVSAKIAPVFETEAEAFRWTLRAWGLTAAAFVSALFLARGLYRLFAGRLAVKTPLVATWTALIVLWVLPPIADAIRANAVAGVYDKVTYSILMNVSPAGVLASVWLDLPVPIAPGFALQLILAAGVTILARQTAPQTLPTRRPA